jgi:hypothetical protein
VDAYGFSFLLFFFPPPLSFFTRLRRRGHKEEEEEEEDDDDDIKAPKPPSKNNSLKEKLCKKKPPNCFRKQTRPRRRRGEMERKKSRKKKKPPPSKDHPPASKKHDTKCDDLHERCCNILQKTNFDKKETRDEILIRRLIATSSAVSSNKFKEKKNTLSVYAKFQPSFVAPPPRRNSGKGRRKKLKHRARSFLRRALQQRPDWTGLD